MLFDGAWLWEEYLATILSEFEHPRNKTGHGRKLLFTDGTGWCYPDFYNGQMVLDAKYKGYEDWNKVQNADLYQVISYMHVLKLDRGGFVVPVSNDEKQLTTKLLNGYGGQMSVFGLRVDHQSPSFSCFVNKMKMEESRLHESIRGFVSKQFG